MKWRRAIPSWRSRRGAAFPTMPRRPLQAALSRGRLASESGHYSIAESCLERAAALAARSATTATRLLGGSTG